MGWERKGEGKAHRDVLLVLCRSHQICTGTVPKTRLARARRANRQRQESNLQNEDLHTHIGGMIGVYVRREQHHTRTHNTHPLAYSYGLRIRHHLQIPEFALACAVTSVLSRATRRAVDAPGAHIRGRPGRGVMPRGRNMSVHRVIRPVVFVRIRLRTSVIFIHKRSREGVKGENGTHAHDNGGYRIMREADRCRSNPRATRKRQKRNTSCANRRRPLQASSRIWMSGPDPGP